MATVARDNLSMYILITSDVLGYPTSITEVNNIIHEHYAYMSNACSECKKGRKFINGT
jgi:hypothetical protein